MNTRKESKTYTKTNKSLHSKTELRSDKIICFICHRMVDSAETIELDHATGRFKVRVCKKHLEV